MRFEDTSANYSSGISLVSPFKASLVDYNEQIVSTVNGEQINLYTSWINISVSGETKMFCENGVFETLGSITIQGMPELNG